MTVVSSEFAVVISETGLLADTGLLQDFWLYYIILICKNVDMK